MRILLCIGLACAAIMLMMSSYAEKQQQTALDTLSGYKLEPRPVLYDDPE